ncbi:hypothetical protein Rhe02_60200 [Rhizocola hellebori]|uniref:Ricin B lectin domain-containing protein n=1 Tax=Rhizocola hellebori TaxID=1392758 RepID=A0A8J3QBS1_9ACTN|nr:LamG-like jellyroll fold domain-containing protein [Rhizocola hellebori]GIH07953.1 hypothetical protein Rhe02_60200 [Rhizocola hellebori]
MLRLRSRVLILATASAVALTIAIPLGTPQPKGSGEFPLASLFRAMAAQFAWADPPSGPRQARGGPVDGEHEASPETTRANGGNGRKPGKVAGALEAYESKTPDRPEWTTPAETRGFDAQTSTRVAEAATRTTDVFTNADGSVTKRQYSKPHNYRLPDGTWRPIDATLVRDASGGLHVDASPVRLRLHGGLTERRGLLPDGGEGVPSYTGLSELATVTLPGGQSISYGLAGAAAVPAQVTGATARYRDMLPHTDVELRASGGGLRETLVLHSPQAASSWVFPWRLQGLRVRSERNGSLSLVDSAGRAVATVPAGSMIDAKGAVSSAVRYEVVDAQIRVTADEAWLRDPARKFPVRVDPTITIIEDADVYVDESTQTGAAEQNGESLAIGLHSPGGKSRTFLAFNDFAGGTGSPSLIGKKLANANLWLFHNWSPDCTQTRPFTAHRVLQPWDVNTLQTGAWPGPQISPPIGEFEIWDNHPGCENPGMIGDIGEWWYITLDPSTFNDWSRGEPNYGLALSASDTDPMAAKRFASIDFDQFSAPYLDLLYADNQAPQVERQLPEHGAQAATLTPLLSIVARDPDNWPQAMTTTFLVFNKDGVKVADSGPIGEDNWKVPVGALRWGEVYTWTAIVSDSNKASTSQTINLLSTLVTQPSVTSVLAQNTDKGFSPTAGNYTTAAVDVQVPSVGPVVSITRSYNSLDPRKAAGFGAGWSTLVDVAATEKRDLESNQVQTVTITYPNGQEVTFGRNADGVYTPPPGRFATLTEIVGGGYELIDKEGTGYRFTEPSAVAGRLGLTRVTDAQGRQMTLQYTSGRVSSLTSASGRKLRLTWVTPSGATAAHVDTVRTDALVAGDATSESVWTYTYTGDRLTKVCPPTSTTKCTVYTYVSGPQYPSTVQNLGPRTYWRLNETSGDKAYNSVIENVVSGYGRYTGVTFGQPGPLVGSTATSAAFDGSSSRIEFGTTFAPGGQRSMSMWFKTSTPGAILLGQTRTNIYTGPDEIGTGYFPQLYVGSDGTLTGGFPTRYGPGPLGKLTAHGPHKCVDVIGDQPVDGAGLELGSCVGGETQQWSLDAQERLTVTKAGVTKCVEPAVAAGGNPLGVRLTLSACDTGQDQKWVVKPDGEIEHVQSQLCWGPKAYEVWEIDQPLVMGTCSFYTSDFMTRLFTPSVHNPMRTTVNVADGQWHHVVLSGAGSTQTLYLDGVSRAQKSGTIEDAHLGRTYVGAGVLGGGWPNQPYAPADGSDLGKGSWFTGNIADLAYFDQPLSGESVAQLFSSNQATKLLNKITQPSGAVNASISYDLTSGSVSQVTDAHGGVWKLGKPTVSPSSQSYVSTVLASDPFDYYRMAETGVTTAVNEVNASESTYSSVSLGIKGALFPDTTVAAFNGNSSYLRLSTKDIPSTGPTSVSLWFKVPGMAATGGVLYSYQDTAVGGAPTGNFTPALYVGIDGKLRGRFWSGAIAPITSTSKVNDGLWHHAVLSSSGTAQSLYLDGAKVGTLNGATSAHGGSFAYVGAGAWTGSPSTFGNTGYFNGQIAEFAYFKSALTDADVKAQFKANSTPMVRGSGWYKGTGTGALETGSAKGLDAAHSDVLTMFPAGDIFNNGTNDYFTIETDGYLYMYQSDDSGGGYSDWTLLAPGWNTKQNVFSPGDFNGDGTSDVIFRDAGNNKLYLSRSTGIGQNYMNFVEISSANWSNRDIFSPGDFDGDGKADVLYRQYSDNKLYLLQGNGTGGWKTGTAIQLQTGWGGRTPIHSRGDFDGDGLPDVLYRNSGTGYVYYIKGDGAGGLTGSPVRVVQDFLDKEMVFAPGDIDGDEKGDLLFRRVYQSSGDDTGLNPGFRMKTVKVTDPTNKIITHVYDMAAGGREIEQIDARGGRTRFGYDTAGFLRSTLDPNGNLVVEDHDVRGNVIARTTCQDRSEEKCSTIYTTYFPDATSKVLSPDPRNDMPLTMRDGRSSSAADDRYKTTLTYDTRGNRTAVTDPLSRVTTTDYTDGTTGVPAGLPWRISYPGGAVETISYHPNGDVATTVDKAGLETRYTYDPLGRVKTMTAISDSYPGGLVTLLDYDKAGRLTQQSNPAVTNRVTGAVHTAVATLEYDFDGHVTSQTVADTTGGDAARTILNGYNTRGQLTSITDTRGKSRTFTYDTYGNKVTEVDPNGVTMAYTYDPTAQLLTVTMKNWTGDPNNPVPAQDLLLQSRSYDKAGRLASVTDAMGWQTLYTYWDNNLPATVSRKDPSSGAVFVVESSSYDPAGNLVAKTTNNGVTTTSIAVDAASRQQSLTLDPTGVNRTISYTFAPDDTVLATRVTDSSGTEQFIDATYDTAGRQRTQSVRGSAMAMSWTMDQRGLQTSVTDSAGHVTHFEYDEAGSLAVQIDPSTEVEEGGGAPVQLLPVTTVGYDTFGDEVERRDAKGRVTVTARNPAGEVSSVTLPPYTPPGGTQPIVAVHQIRYDNAGQILETEDPLGHITAKVYDQLGRVARMTAADTGVTRFAYNLNGDPLSGIDPEGARREATYDFMGRVLTTTLFERTPAAAFTTSFAYHPGGWLASTTPPGRASTTFDYNAVGEQTKVTDGAGNASITTYDFVGRPVEVRLPDGTKQRAGYDAAGNPNLRQQLNAAGAVLAQVSSTFDGDGRMLTATDARQHTKSFEYNANGQVTRLVEPTSPTENIVTTYGYDAVGARTRFTDGRLNRFITTYNAWSEVESEVEPGGATFTTGYDAAGRVTTRSAPGGVSITNTYDNADRLIGQTGAGADASTANRSYGYDLKGRLRTVTAGGNTTSLSYNDRGLLTSASGAGGTSSFTYSDDGQVLSRTDASGTSTYTHDSVGRLATVTDASTGNLSTYGYNSLSQVNSITYSATGNKRILTYDERHLPDVDDLQNSAGQTIAKIAYDFDPNGNLSAKSTTGFAGSANNVYTYDFANRLTSWDNGSTITSYGYDKSGNRTQIGSRVLTYNERNQLTGDGQTSYSYTPRGTLSGSTVGTVTTPSTFDAYGQQISQGTQTYTYDGLGRLLTTGTGAALSYSGITNQLASDGTRSYSRGPNGELIGVKSGGAGVYAWTDLHQDVVGLFTSTGSTLSASRSYDPLGQVIQETGTVGALGYQSGWTDPATGQVNMHSRWYRPSAGQFGSRDTVSLESTPNSVRGNRYQYGDGNPLTVTDPTGHAGDGNDWMLNMFHSAISAANMLVDIVRRYASELVGAMIDLRDRLIDGLARFQSWMVEQAERAAQWAREQAERAAEAARQLAQAAADKAQRAYDAATSAAKRMIENVGRFAEETARVFADAYTAVENWVKEHKADIAGFVVSVVVGVGCGIAIGWTGVGAVACGVVASMAGSFVTGVMQGKTGAELAGDVLLGGLTGLIGGPLTGKAFGAMFRGLGGSKIVGSLVKGIAGKATVGLQALRGAGSRLANAVRARVGSAAASARNGLSNMVSKVRGMFRQVATCGHSFDPGTAVVMAGGALKAISEVKEGDLVVVTDPSTGETTTRPVVKLHRNVDRDLTEVRVKDAKTGKVSVLKTTSTHAVWNVDKQTWTKAGRLQPGTTLSEGSVVSVKTTTGEAEMYDLTVKGIHTYYVVAGDSAVLVHNCPRHLAFGRNFEKPLNHRITVSAFAFDMDAEHLLLAENWREQVKEAIAGLATGKTKISFMLEYIKGSGSGPAEALKQARLALKAAKDQFPDAKVNDLFDYTFLVNDKSKLSHTQIELILIGDAKLMDKVDFYSWNDAYKLWEKLT